MLFRDGLRLSMDFRQIEYFLAVAERGSFMEASRRLRIAQSALSRQLALLENELGVRLFHRHGRGIVLTGDGDQFRVAVAPAMRDIDALKYGIRAHSSVPDSKVTIGMGLTYASTLGSRLIKNFRSRFPQVRLQVELLGGLLNDALSSGLVDMAVTSNVSHVSTLQAYPLIRLGLFLIGTERAMSDLDVTHDDVSARTLHRLPLVLVGPAHGIRREIDLMAEECGIELNVVVEVNALQSIMELIHEDAGFTILPFGAAASAKPGLAVRRIVEPAPSIDFFIAFSRNRRPTLAMQELEATIREETHLAVAEGRLIGEFPE